MVCLKLSLFRETGRRLTSCRRYESEPYVMHWKYFLSCPLTAAAAQIYLHQKNTGNTLQRKGMNYYWLTFFWVLFVLLLVTVHLIFFYSKQHSTAADFVSELWTKITETSSSRFSNRASVGRSSAWLQALFVWPSHEILVKLTDDEGRAEDGPDTGGPVPDPPNELPENRKNLWWARGQEVSHVWLQVRMLLGGMVPTF